MSEDNLQSKNNVWKKCLPFSLPKWKQGVGVREEKDTASSNVLLCKAWTGNSMPSWRLINELFFKSFVSRLFHVPSATTGCFSLYTSILLVVLAVRHKCERSLASARETTISWVQRPSGCVSRDFTVPCYSVTPARQMVVQVNNFVAGALDITPGQRLPRHVA